MSRRCNHDIYVGRYCLHCRPAVEDHDSKGLGAAETGEEKVELKARCLCGKCNFATTIPKQPVNVTFCSCKGCRHAFGGLQFMDVDWTLPMPQSPSLQMFIFSPMAWLYFCSTCGTTVFWFDHHEQKLFVNSGAIEDPSQLEFRYLGWCWLGSTGDGGAADWLTKVNGQVLTRWKRGKIVSEHLPTGWYIGQAHPEYPLEETVRAHCHCKGVDFTISRPKDKYTDEELCGLESPASPHTWLNPKGEKFVAGLCACTSCRLASGLDVVTWAFIPKANLHSRTGEPLKLDSGTLKHYKSSEDVRRYFCGKCGAFVFWDCDVRPALIDVAVGLLHSVSGARAEAWLEYCKEGIKYKEDAVNKTLVNAYDEGYLTWVKNKEQNR